MQLDEKGTAKFFDGSMMMRRRLRDASEKKRWQYRDIAAAV